MKYNKNIFCEDIAIGYESLELSPEAQRYLETDGVNLIAATMHVLGRYVPGVPDCCD